MINVSFRSALNLDVEKRRWIPKAVALEWKGALHYEAKARVRAFPQKPRMNYPNDKINHS